MLQFFFEIIVAVLAVYGAYTALHELAALICKWIGAPTYSQEGMPKGNRKEDSYRLGGGDSDAKRTADRNESGDELGGSDAPHVGGDD